MDGYNKSPCLPERYRNLGRVREIEEREGRKEEGRIEDTNTIANATVTPSALTFIL